MSNKTRGPNSPYMRGPGGMPGGAPPSPPPPQAKTMYLIAKGREGPETTDDYLDERANGGPEQFQLIQLMMPGGQMGTKFVRGKTIWDNFAETALAAIVKATTRIERGNSLDTSPGPETLSAGDARQVAAMAAAFADAMLEEKKRRDPQMMHVTAGRGLIEP